MYYFYTDGATSGNGTSDADGGWAWALAAPEGEKITIYRSGPLQHTTNNRCELIAVIEACNYALNTELLPMTIVSDSAYIINCYKDKWYRKWVQNGWVNSKREPVANQDLWEQLIPFFDNQLFEFEKVKGHNGKFENEFVDELARTAIVNERIRRSKENGECNYTYL